MAEQETEAKLQQIARAVGEAVKKRLQSGHTIYLYETVYTSVGSLMNDEILGGVFNISAIRKLGLDGWEVTQAIHQTVGIGLTNRSTGDFHTWGGGIGGNIAGAFIVLKKVLRNMDDLNQWGKLDSYIRDHIEDFED